MRNSKHKQYISNSEFFFGLFARYFDSSKNKWRIKINAKRFAFALVLVLASLWVLASTTVYCGLKYFRKYDQISYLQVLKNPFSTDSFRIQMGNAQIKKAYQCMKAGDLQGGFMNLVSGTARNPDDLDARILLAQIYMTGLKDSKHACQTLEMRIVKAFEQKHEKYLQASIYAFSQDLEYKEKSVKLLARCVKHNAVEQKMLSAVLFSILQSFHNNKKHNELVEFCQSILTSVDDTKIKSIAVKNCALTLANISQSDKALQLLKENNITTGEVASVVKIANYIERSDEISAAKLIKIALLKTENKAQIYELFANLANDFGDKKSETQAKNMISILSGNIIDAEFENLAQDTSADLSKKVEHYIQTNPKNIDKLCAKAISSKNLQLINCCLKNKIPQSVRFTLSLAKAEFLLLNKDSHEASTTLNAIRYSDYTKSNKLEHMFDGFDIVLNALSGKDVCDAIDTFVQKHPQMESVSLAKLFYKLGLKNHSINILTKTLEKHPNDIRVASYLTTTAFEEGDIYTIINAYERHSIRIPIKILAQLGTKLQSDRSVFFSQNTRNDLMKKSNEAQEKITQYKKIFGNF